MGFKAIVNDSQAFNLFSKPGIRKFIEFLKPGYTPLGRKSAASRLKKKYYFYKMILNLFLNIFLLHRYKCLDKIKYISLTTDLWKNKKRRYFLTLTAHFFSKNFKFNSMILCFRKFSKSHTAQNISHFIANELNKLNILEKVVIITTDNDAAVALAASNVNKNSTRISCMLHNLNLAVKNGLKLWVKPK